MSDLTHIKPNKSSFDGVRNGFEKVTCILGAGFLFHPKNRKLREAIQSNRLHIDEYYQQLLCLLYRLVFLCIAEERGWKGIVGGSNKGNKKHLIHRIRQMLVSSNASHQDELWNAFGSLMAKLDKGDPSLDLPALGSFLWSADSCRDLYGAKLDDGSLLQALQVINMVNEKDRNHPIRWCDIQADQLGAIYESLLSLVPKIDVLQCSFLLQEAQNNTRKSTGSYYTPPALVETLLQSVLDPIIDRACHQRSRAKAEEALLALCVCDPSCGTGHFLVAASRRLGKRLAQLRTEKGDPSPKVYQQALRDVIERCIYGVDLNPMAVEICKMALWMEISKEAKPLSFWDERIQCGNALLGVWPELLEKGIQTEYFTTIDGRDSRWVANAIRRRNRKERKENSITKTISSQELFVANILISSMVWPKTDDDWGRMAPTQAIWNSIRQGEAHPHLQKLVSLLQSRYHFFHWHLAFPKVMSNGGFDAVIGNPPYVDSEFIKKHHPYFREALNHLYLSTKGNWDLYIPFTELSIKLLKPNGRQGLVTPNKILGSDYAAALQKHFFLTNRIAIIHDFSLQSMFSGANIAVVIVVIEKGKPVDDHQVVFQQYIDGCHILKKVHASIQQLASLPKGYLSFPITCPEPELLYWLNTPQRVMDVAICSDGSTTGEAYLIKKWVSNNLAGDKVDEKFLRLVNTGTIDPFVLLWGKKSISYLGFKGHYPVIESKAFQREFPRRYQQAIGDKVVLAGMSSRLEAVVAPVGYVCGKSAVLVQPNQGVCPYALTVLLNSQAYINLYIGLFAMRGMSGRSLNIGPRQIEQLPIPPTISLSPVTDAALFACEEKGYLDRLWEAEDKLSLIGRFLHQELGDALKMKLLGYAEEVIREAWQ